MLHSLTAFPGPLSLPQPPVQPPAFVIPVMDLQAAWFAAHFKQPQAEPSEPHLVALPQLPEASAPAVGGLAPFDAEAAPVSSSQPVRWWQDAAMTFGDVGGLPVSGSMGDAPAAPRPGFNAFKVGRQAATECSIHLLA